MMLQRKGKRLQILHLLQRIQLFKVRQETIAPEATELSNTTSSDSSGALSTLSWNVVFHLIMMMMYAQQNSKSQTWPQTLGKSKGYSIDTCTIRKGMQGIALGL
jgi:hypothetical protein